MTKQEQFDIVARHLLTQNARSETDEFCAYNSPEGLKCAVGVLIPSELYRYKMEGRRWAVLVEDYEDLRALQYDNKLLNDLQLLHDRVDVNRWGEELKVVAEIHELNYEVVDAVLSVRS